MQIDYSKLYSKDVEQSILSCLLVFEDSRINFKNIESEDFYDIKNKKIFEMMKELWQKNKPVQMISIKELAKEKNMDGNEVFKYCLELTDKAISSATLDYYIKKLKNYSIRRKVVANSLENINDMIDSNADEEAEEIQKKVIESLKNIHVDKQETAEMNMTQLLTATLEDIDNKYNRRDDYRYHTGILDLDKITDGLHEQELTLIAARPGCGKTALALNIMKNISKKGLTTYFASLEMSAKQIGSRLLSSVSGVDSHRLRSGWLEDKDFEKINIAMTELNDLKMIIDDKSVTIQDIELKVTQLKEEKNVDLLVIDYLQLLKSKTKFNSREQEVADISRRLKLMSKNLNIPIIALCQLNRESLKRTRPCNADLRESGSLEQDADNIIFIYAEDEYMQKRMVETELIVSKQRNGPTRCC